MIAMDKLLQLIECNNAGAAQFHSNQHALAANTFRFAIDFLYSVGNEYTHEHDSAQAQKEDPGDEVDNDGTIFRSCEPFEDTPSDAWVGLTDHVDMRSSGCYLFRRPFTLSIATNNDDPAPASAFSTRDVSRVSATLIFNLALTCHCQDSTSDQVLSLYQLMGSLYDQVDLMSIAAVNNSVVWYIENAEFGLARIIC
jgi:hypothetical protein